MFLQRGDYSLSDASVGEDPIKGSIVSALAHFETDSWFCPSDMIDSESGVARLLLSPRLAPARSVPFPRFNVATAITAFYDPLRNSTVQNNKVPRPRICNVPVTA